MARNPLTLPFVLAIVALTAGCAGSYSPSRTPPPAPPVEDREAPTEAPAEAPAPVEERAQPPARPGADAPSLALLRQSKRAAEGGDVESAIAYVERAIRLDPRNPALWLRLAELQLEAGRPADAEQLAHKAIALAGSRREQQRQGWLLVAAAREAQGDAGGAAEIRDRWRTGRG